MASPQKLSQLAQELRIQVLRMNHKAGSGHTGGSFSCAEILTVLYENYLTLRPQEPDWPQRDRFVLSKGHAAPALYATLARKGFCGAAELDTLRCCGSMLQGHPCMHRMPGVDMSTGSLGMGLSVGLGMALSARLKNEDWRVFVLCGDGELQEGQNWEAFMAISKWRPANLTVTIDYNQVQLDGTLDEIMPLGDLKAKLESFGLMTYECGGHDPASLIRAYDRALLHSGPAAVIAHTVKGKGVSFMEGQSAWHGKPISGDEFASALAELEAA
jgi:transketolase